MWSRLDANLPSIQAALAASVDCDAAEIALNRNSMEGLSTVIFGAGCSRWKWHVDRAPRPHSIHVAPDGTVPRRAAPHRQIRPLEPWDLQLRAVAGHRSRHQDPSRNQRPCPARSPARVDPLLGGTGSWHSRFQEAHAGRRRAASSGQPVLDCRCRMRHVEQELRDSTGCMRSTAAWGRSRA